VSIRSIRATHRLSVFLVGVFVLTVATTNADQPTAATTADQNEDQESLSVRYARAHLTLANLDLQRAMDVDKRYPNILPAAALESLKRHVEIDRAQLKQAQEAPYGNFHDIYTRSAQNAVAMAEADLKRKREVFARMPDNTTKYDAERAEAVLEIAKLHHEVTDEKESSISSMMYLQWQIEMLRNQLLELQLQVQLGR